MTGAAYTKTMKAGDTGEPLQIAIVDNIGRTPVDLTDASVIFTMLEINDDGTTTALVDAAATIESPETAGLITYNWEAGDTTVAGAHQAYFVVTYDSGIVETYPRKGFLEINIESM